MSLIVQAIQKNLFFPGTCSVTGDNQSPNISPSTDVTQSPIHSNQEDCKVIHDNVYDFYDMIETPVNFQQVQTDEETHSHCSENNESVQSDDPAEFEQPDEPAEFEQPDDPAESEQPDDPAESEQPDDPAESEQPDDPAESEQPDDLAESEQPDEPAESELPDDPAESEQPDDRAESEQPDERAESELLDDPAESEQPDERAESEQPDDPAESEQPDEQTKSEQPDERAKSFSSASITPPPLPTQPRRVLISQCPADKDSQFCMSFVFGQCEYKHPRKGFECRRLIESQGLNFPGPISDIEKMIQIYDEVLESQGNICKYNAQNNFCANKFQGTCNKCHTGLQLDITEFILKQNQNFPLGQKIPHERFTNLFKKLVRTGDKFKSIQICPFNEKGQICKHDFLFKNCKHRHEKFQEAFIKFALADKDLKLKLPLQPQVGFSRNLETQIISLKNEFFDI